MGCDIHKRAYMLGDNKSVVDSPMIPHVKLHKWHTELSLHHVREAIAGDLILFHHINGDPFNENFSMADVEEEGNVDEAKSD